MTQGSSCLATLGFGTESRWDSQTLRFKSARRLRARFPRRLEVGSLRNPFVME